MHLHQDGQHAKSRRTKKTIRLYRLHGTVSIFDRFMKRFQLLGLFILTEVLPRSIFLLFGLLKPDNQAPCKRSAGPLLTDNRDKSHSLSSLL